MSWHNDLIRINGRVYRSTNGRRLNLLSHHIVLVDQHVTNENIGTLEDLMLEGACDAVAVADISDNCVYDVLTFELESDAIKVKLAWVEGRTF